MPSSGCSVVRLLIVVITAALRPTVVVFVTAHSTPARLQQQRISRFLRELSQGYRVLWLMLLAPDIIEAILNGRQPPNLQLDRLLTRFPVEWGEQAEELSLSSEELCGKLGDDGVR